MMTSPVEVLNLVGSQYVALLIKWVHAGGSLKWVHWRLCNFWQ